MEKIVKNQLVASPGFEPGSKGYEPFKATTPPTRNKLYGEHTKPQVETIMHLQM